MMPERLTETRDLEERIRAHYREEAQTIPADTELWERLAPWLTTGGQRGRAITRRRGIALATAVFAGSVFWINQGRADSPLVPALLVPTTAPAATVAPGTGDGGATTVPPPGAPTAFPRGQAAVVPAPNLMPKPPHEVLDQGIHLAVLRAIVNPGHVTAFFFAVDGPPDLAGWTILPNDLRVLDQEGTPYASHVTHLESVANVTVGAVGIGPLRPESTELTLFLTTLRATGPNGQARTIRGRWDIQLLQNLQVESIHPDGLVDMPYIACFQSNGVRVGSSYFDPCALPAVPPTPTHAVRSVVVAPTVQLPLPGMERTATPIPAGHLAPAPVMPAPTLPPAPATPLPTLGPASLPDDAGATNSPAVASGRPVTPTPFRGGEFTDWRHGFFGVALTVSAPRPHRIYVLVKPDGIVEAVSEATFDAARNAH